MKNLTMHTEFAEVYFFLKRPSIPKTAISKIW